MIEARRAVRTALADVAPGRCVLLACSGGSDSLALAIAVAAEAPKFGLTVRAAVVDHQIREGSEREARAVAEQLEHMRIDSTVLTPKLSGEGLGPEGEARTMRYGALAAEARRYATPGGPAIVLTGHTADDQAETVLLGLARGSGLRSLAGMPAVTSVPGNDDVELRRPLLEFRKDDLRRELAAERISWIEDPSNRADGPWRAADGSALRRAAIRDRALPALEVALGDDPRPRLARTAALVRRDEEYLAGVAAREAERMGLGGPMSVKDLRALHPAVRSRVLGLMALAGGARGGDLTGVHMDALNQLIFGGGTQIDLPGAVAVRAEGRITVTPRRLPPVE